jgi:acetyltransferase-like isoleucine patch superfamily enzyme
VWLRSKALSVEASHLRRQKHSSGLLATRLGELWNYSLLEKIEYITELYWLLKTQLYYRRFFGQIGRRSKILNPMRLKNVENIFLGDHVIINKHAFLLTARLSNGERPRITIGDGCVIGHVNHITAVNDVAIGPNVLTADRVHISDNSHSFADPATAIIDQPIVSKGRVRIGEGSWIGENASVLSCSIGRNCVIGSNAVVLSDIPDYSVAVGAPARVVRRFNPGSGLWEKTGASQ